MDSTDDSELPDLENLPFTYSNPHLILIYACDNLYAQTDKYEFVKDLSGKFTNKLAAEEWYYG